MTFSDGQTLSFEEDEIVVFVGPNNAGKSAALRELQQWVSKSLKQKVVINAKLKKTGTSEDLRGYLERFAQRSGDLANLTYGGIGYNIHHSLMAYFDGAEDRHPVAPFFSTRLATETRINGSDPAGGIALYQAPPSHPIHLLLMDPELESTVSKLFRKAFGQDLIVFRAGGSNYPIYVGSRPDLAPGEDALSKSFIDQLLATAVPLQNQGDGMRSFVTVLLHGLVADNHSIQFLDEPEAFLHPPQARLLGEFLANNRRAKSQMFIATHSTDILDGLLAAGNNKIRIVRVQRVGSINRVKELSKERTAAIASDTLTQYSGVFKGIFYRRVIITESDGDCLFYSSFLNLPSISGEVRPDVLFIHASGKHRMAKLVDTLRALDVPVTVITDVDILSEENAFRGLYESIGGNWDEIRSAWATIKNSVQAISPPINASQIKQMISAELQGVSDTGQFPKDAERNIKAIFRTVSPWDALKQAGRSALRGSTTIQMYDRLVDACAVLGLWIVPVGELEGFCRSIEAKHGPSFVEKVIEERDLERDSELADARAFVTKIWQQASVA
ncbi:AAA family ATPase [Massilia sp. PAMC28688]|uniref:ATP-dependent nuclease n=1 Tax=Massilia sp. PAMC28688 TaxID=2861283 RepID=UPI001C62A5BD|nr:AAA family ATPase [Massilia sp. PAMC28688]QYF91884.1 AAA family ATPase [Massilia sp. PAMC28688]